MGDVLFVWTAVSNMFARLTTPRPPRYYSHFILAQTKAQSVNFLLKELL